ncbi:YoaK family protein [Glutamicibacter sp. MNS18]|uniref:YoaK family protein n=1 Tax=Glutamicibacter sp. MNS18 TaxID=2989817 RepID=UPI002235C9FC|nr:YoaK family protein [Glutamicibacter sp. MNS18]MCW4465861.1 YoaK family protein [Glutamicibacter sp. MNS18]
MARNLSWPGILFAGGITAVAGFVDGVGFIHFGGYFLSFMSGNSTRSSAALAEGDPGGWLLAMGFVSCFVLGVVISTLVSARVRHYRRPVVMYISAAFLLLGALLGPGGGVFTAGALATAMGAVNVSYTRSGEVSLGLTYMTGTLVKLGQQLAAALSGGQRMMWAPYAVLWLMITLGSLAGAFSYLHYGLLVLWFAVAAMLLWATMGFLHERRLRALKTGF